ncbi:hypothetical protein [Moraxella boevrei]|uniref:hypothetical protein n=1 Tax=Faucicola boevrei TaxID=346665 RepID=UPI003734F352
MTNSIQLTPFDNKTGEIMAIAHIWQKEVEIYLDDNFENLPNQEQHDKIIQYLEWLNAHQKSVIDFALDEDDFIDNFNDWVKDEIKKHGKAELYDGTILTQPISYDEVYQSILLSSVYVVFFDGEIMLSVDLVTDPDYFGGHAFNVEINDDFSIQFGGVNG